MREDVRVGMRRALVDSYRDHAHWWEVVLLAQRLVRAGLCRAWVKFLAWCLIRHCQHLWVHATVQVASSFKSDTFIPLLGSRIQCPQCLLMCGA
jgi:hypothetical protein